MCAALVLGVCICTSLSACSRLGASIFFWGCYPTRKRVTAWSWTHASTHVRLLSLVNKGLGTLYMTKWTHVKTVFSWPRFLVRRQVTSRTPRISVASLVYVPSHGLSAGAIAAIFFAVLLGALLLAGGGYWLYQVLPACMWD